MSYIKLGQRYTLTKKRSIQHEISFGMQLSYGNGKIFEAVKRDPCDDICDYAMKGLMDCAGSVIFKEEGGNITANMCPFRTHVELFDIVAPKYLNQLMEFYK